MTVGIIQSSYIPWKGYFDFIDDVDVFVMYDDVQYSKNTWRNRNKIKTALGTTWLTVPVKYNSLSKIISETEIDYNQDWQSKHLRLIKENYYKSDFFEQIYDEFSELILNKYNNISQLNVALIKWIMNKLGINTPLVMSAELNPMGSKTERVIDILKKLKATEYLSGPSAENYLDYKMFEEVGIGLNYKSYIYKEYPQQNSPFEGEVTILDLLLNIGLNSREFFKSKISNKIIIPHSYQVKIISAMSGLTTGA